MNRFRIEEAAAVQIEDIYLYTERRWGETQAEAYVGGLFEFFDDIAARKVGWRPILADLAVDGYVQRYQRHFVYWRVLSDETVGVFAVLHERMHQFARLRQSLGESEP